jgi:hypothetical protein
MSLVSIIMPGSSCPMFRIDRPNCTVLYPIIWKPIPHYEKLYEISNHGYYRNMKTGKVLKFVKNNLGYLRAELYKNGDRKRFMIHRLVARVFIGAVRGYTTLEVNHIDGVKRNNHVTNLEWMTKSDNNSHRHHDLGKNNFKPEQSFVEVDADDDLGSILAID